LSSASIEGVTDGRTTQRSLAGTRGFLVRAASTRMMLCQCLIGHQRFETVNIANRLNFDAASCPSRLETTMRKHKISQSFSSATHSGCWIHAGSCLEGDGGLSRGVHVTKSWADRLPVVQCGWCSALCAHTVCVVLCSVCSYSVRGAIRCVQIRCAWCCALCAPTVCVVLCTVCAYSMRGAVHCVHVQYAWCCALCAPTVWYSGAVWTLPNHQQPTKFTMKSPSWEASRISPSQEFPRVSCNPKVCCCVHWSPPHIHIPSFVNPINAFPCYFFNIRFNIALPSTFKSYKSFFPSGFPTWTVYALLESDSVALFADCCAWYNHGCSDERDT
jgi:hypothetical protein